MNNKSENNKIALKLLNKYADCYKTLEEDNKILRSEIIDLKTSLKINKCIIEEFLKNSSNIDLNIPYINKLKEEINNLSLIQNKLKKEKEELISKLNYAQQISNDTLNRIREECEILKSKMFIYDNLIIMKENIIENMRIKINKLKDSDSFNEIYEKEIYVIEPSIAVNQIYDELVLFKNFYINLSKQINDNSNTISNLEKHLINQQNENYLLKEKLKSKKYDNFYKSKVRESSILATNNVSNFRNYNMTKEGYDDDPIQYTISQNDRRYLYDFKEQLSKTVINENIKKTKSSKFENEEWNDIIRSAQISKEDLQKMLKNSSLSKLFDAIEMLNKVNLEKSLQIKLLETENEDLNSKNSQLNNENIKLLSKCNEQIDKINNLKHKISLLGNSMRAFEKDENISMINNTGTTNPKWINRKMNSLKILTDLLEKRTIKIGGELEVSKTRSSTHLQVFIPSKISDNEIDLQKNDDFIMDIKKLDHRDPLINVENTKNSSINDLNERAKNKKESINENNSIDKTEPKIINSINTVEGNPKIKIQNNNSSYKTSIKDKFLIETIESTTSEIKENFIDSCFISGRKDYYNF